MRFKNTSGYLKVYAVAGTQTVLFSFDIAKSRVDGKKLMGFLFERKDAKGTIIKMNGTKRFASLQGTSSQKISLVQTYFWKDYTADPGQTYIYTIRAMLALLLHLPRVTM